MDDIVEEDAESTVLLVWTVSGVEVAASEVISAVVAGEVGFGVFGG